MPRAMTAENRTPVMLLCSRQEASGMIVLENSLPVCYKVEYVLALALNSSTSGYHPAYLELCFPDLNAYTILLQCRLILQVCERTLKWGICNKFPEDVNVVALRTVLRAANGSQINGYLQQRSRRPKSQISSSRRPGQRIEARCGRFIHQTTLQK